MVHESVSQRSNRGHHIRSTWQWHKTTWTPSIRVLPKPSSLSGPIFQSDTSATTYAIITSHIHIPLLVFALPRVRRSISSLLLLLLLGPPRSSSSTPAGHPLAAGVRLASHPSIHPSMAVAMMHYFFFRRHRRDDDGGGEQDMLLRESFLRRMEEGAAAAAARDQRRSPPTLTPTPRRCYSREAGYRFVRVNQLNRCIQLVIISLRLFFSCST